jgi:3-oxoacyl-[acyl-carrier-protein] synthase III
MKNRNAVIVGTGSFAPARVLTNEYFNELLGENVASWLEENVHIRERRWCSDNESTVDLCEKAAQRALEHAGITAGDLDQIIIATDTPEYISPSTAAVLQDRIGASKAGTFDLNTACAGFVTALDTASKYIIADDQYQYILVVGAYAMSKYLNLADKKTVTLFADGAGAVVLKSEINTDRGFQTSMQFSQGQYYSWMGIYGGGTKLPIEANGTIANKDHLLKFVQRFPKELNPNTWTAMAREMMDRMKIGPEDVDMFLMTQININAIWEMLDNLGLPRERAHYIMDRFGYTGSAAIPMALDEAKKLGKIKKGDTIFLIGSGGGLAFAGAAFKL